MAIILYATNALAIVVTKVQEMEFYDSLKVIGECKNLKNREYYAQVNGNVDYIVNKPHVVAGDVILVIDQQIAERLKAQIESDTKAISENYKRQLDLFDKKYISQEKLDTVYSQYAAAQLKQVEQLKVYHSMIITAPYDAKIGGGRLLVGDNIQKGDYLFTLMCDDAQTILMELPQAMYGKINNQSRCKALPHPSQRQTQADSQNDAGELIELKIDFIGNSLSNNGTFLLKAIANQMIAPSGGYAQIEINFNHHKAMCVPEQCLMQDDNGYFLYKISEDDKGQKVARKIYIDIGTKLNRFVEIKNYPSQNNTQVEQQPTAKKEVVIKEELATKEEAKGMQEQEVMAQGLAIGEVIVLEGLTKVHDGAQISEIIEDQEMLDTEKEVK
ncbi:efflux RND transporter periplasmic adaptor subunit [Candidatus Sarmatiella mevalonica]|uniref:efflux RND transporter periplasmic adaptor subunit n=1 Tax=Candidatus Sarmatiella mevalonica TaxID=2770581 RepID=UPI0019241F78|nr:efflux RND transporter periplasmic adaptor subunit [Candidatus Sarmatiella mevalonica]